MSPRQVIAASLVVLVLAGFQLANIAFQREDWPFSSYPMYAGRQGDRIAWLRVYGVTPSAEVPLVPEHHLRPFDAARLIETTPSPSARERVGVRVAPVFTHSPG